jgi:hypothetical protein
VGSACGDCSKTKKVCSVCLEALADATPAKDPFVKDGTCEAGCKVTAEMSRSPCPACGEKRRAQSAAICGPCAEKRGVCVACLKRPAKASADKEKPAFPLEGSCAGCGACGTGATLDHPCASCGKLTWNIQKLCVACSKKHGACGICGKATKR